MADFANALRRLRPRPLAEPPQRHLFQPAPAASLTQQLLYLKMRNPAPVQHKIGSHPGGVPPGLEEVTPHGRHYVVRQSFDVRLSRFSCGDLRQFQTVMRETGNVPDRDSIVFLDTETTGIQGAGMVPFLIGAGYFEGDDFQMVQYFIRDFDEEPSMMHALQQLLERFNMIVTYNGATFDIPLLESRFTLARFDNPFTGKAHLDLLTGARRLWRNGHGSCRLVALEREIVSFLRGPDVPGAAIPRVYFDYVNHGSSPQLNGVFTHNVFDVISLAALTICACDRVVDEAAPFDPPSDLYSLARILENTREWRRCESLYEMARDGGLIEPFRSRAAEHLSMIYRRSGRHERGLALCRELMEGPAFILAAYEGAAIHYERIAGDHVRALEIVDQALSRLDDMPQHKRWRALLQTRRERLRQKVIQF
jgi:hypothetical protein